MPGSLGLRGRRHVPDSSARRSRAGRNRVAPAGRSCARSASRCRDGEARYEDRRAAQPRHRARAQGQYACTTGCWGPKLRVKLRRAGSARAVNSIGSDNAATPAGSETLATVAMNMFSRHSARLLKELALNFSALQTEPLPPSRPTSAFWPLADIPGPRLSMSAFGGKVGHCDCTA